jgi:hypothetical protein
MLEKREMYRVLVESQAKETPFEDTGPDGTGSSIQVVMHDCL